MRVWLHAESLGPVFLTTSTTHGVTPQKAVLLLYLRHFQLHILAHESSIVLHFVCCSIVIIHLNQIHSMPGGQIYQWLLCPAGQPCSEAGGNWIQALKSTTSYSSSLLQNTVYSLLTVNLHPPSGCGRESGWAISSDLITQPSQKICKCHCGRTCRSSIGHHSHLQTHC